MDKGWLVVNIGCIECGVSSAIVGLFDDADKAHEVADALQKSHGWRGGGQNEYEVFPIPEERNVIADEYKSSYS